MTFIPIGWKIHRLDELGFVGRGRSRHRPRNDPFLYGGSYPFVQTADIKAANLRLREFTQTYNETGLAQSKMWAPGTLCITIAANIAETAILAISACFPDSVIGFIADPKKADTVFIKHYIDFIKLQMQQVSHGTTQDNLSLDKLLRFDFVVPEAPVQRKIATILSTYDDLIENNFRRIKIMEEMAQTLYREWFVKFQFPGHQKVKMVDSPLGKIPEGWEVIPLNNLCIRITDGAHSSPKSVEIGYPMASVKDMRDWALDEDSCRRIAESDYHTLLRNDCKPLVNDVLIAKDGSYLKHAFVVEEEKELVILSSIAILRPNLEQILPHILCMYLRQPEVRSRLSGYVSGAALPRIVLKDFAKFLAVKPEMPLQTQFMMAVEPFVRLIHVLIKKNLTLRRTRDLLLPKLISGELNVSELDITIPEGNG